MRQYLVRITGLAALALSLHANGFAQQGEDHDTIGNKKESTDEIIIMRKNDKDVKLSVEIRDGQVFINGKPVSEFQDDNVTIRKKKMMTLNGMEGMDLFDGDGESRVLVAPRSPYRNRSGAWNLNGDGNRALLGVNSDRSDGGLEGAKIKMVTKGSAAEKAGLKTGDLITKVNDFTIVGPEDLTEDKVNITFKRDGKEQKATATLGKARENGSYNYNYEFNTPEAGDFHFKMPNVNVAPRVFSFGESRPKLGIRAQDTEDGKGVKVLDIDEDSPADKAGIKEGDIITRFDGKDVNSATELADIARDSRGKSDMKVSVTHDGKSREVDVKIPKKLKTADL